MFRVGPGFEANCIVILFIHLHRCLKPTLRGLVAAALCCAGAYGAGGPKSLARFTLREYLNRDWQNELVTFAVNPDMASRKDLVLLDGGGKNIAFQWCVEGGPAIAFLASLPKLGQVEYRLAEGRARPAPDLELREGADFLELASDEAGIRLNKNPKAAQLGPIAGVRLRFGRICGGRGAAPGCAAEELLH